MTDLLLSLLPIAALAFALSVLRMKAWRAALGAWGVAVAAAFAIMLTDHPAGAVASRVLGATGEGVLFALHPICLVVVGALFVYSLTVASGAMDTIRKGLASVSDDPRILLLLIVWGFGNFIEGMAGFGTAVAIPAALLVGIGINPLKAVLVSLVANTTATAFGSVGVPLMTLARVTGCGTGTLGRTAAVVQSLVTALGPVLVLLVYGGPRALKGMWRPVVLSSAAFILPWISVAWFVGVELPDVIGGLAVMLVLGASESRRHGGSSALDLRGQLRAWTPFGCVVLFLAIAAFLPSAAKKYASPGVLVLSAGFAGGALQGLTARRMLGVLGKTLAVYWPALATICAVLALARVMTESGMIESVAAALVSATGRAYPFFATLVGALGGFVTGSGTSACVLFGRLQVSAAEVIGIQPDMLAAANVMGAGIGKMICPQSIAIGCAAAGLAGSESAVLRRMLPWFAAVLLLASLVVGLAVQ